MSNPPIKPHEWHVNGTPFPFGETPAVMGIVNVTPDSFSDGGDHNSPSAAIIHALQLAEQGADILDIGGESTRPGAEPVPVNKELQRVLPVIEGLASQTRVPISIDTMKAKVAAEALQAGATIVNDVSGLTFDQRMSEVCAASHCGIIVMHMLGTPQTMQNDPTYYNVVEEVSGYLERRVDQLAEQGIDPRRIMLDPGIGFGKTAGDNLELLSNIERLRQSDRPLLIGHSRKRFLGKLLGKPIDERTSGTIGVSIAIAEQGAEMIRVHDVAAVKDALTAWNAIRTGQTLD